MQMLREGDTLARADVWISSRSAMAVSRTNFRAGDRVRGADWFDEIAGAVATVVEAVEVRGDDWAAQDLLVRFDRPVVIFDEPQWTFLHSAHNFEYIQDTRTAPGIHESPSDPQTTRRRLTYKQPPPPAYRVCEGCRYLGYECTCAGDGAVEQGAVEPPRFEPFSGTPHRL